MGDPFEQFSKDTALLQSRIAVFRSKKQDLDDLTSFISKILDTSLELEPVTITFHIPLAPKPRTVKANSIDLTNNQIKQEAKYKNLTFIPSLRFLARLHELLKEDLDREQTNIHNLIQEHIQIYGNNDDSLLLEPPDFSSTEFKPVSEPSLDPGRGG